MQFSQDLDEDTKKRIESGRRYTELLKQGQHDTMPFERQVAMIFGANNGLLDNSIVESIKLLEKTFLSFIDQEAKDLLPTISKERDLSDGTQAKLKELIASFVSTHPSLYVAQ